MNPLAIVCLLTLLAAPSANPAPAEKKAEPTPAAPTVKTEPATVDAKVAAEPVVVADKTPMDPEVRKAVDSMQKFYEDTKDFLADFNQVYEYKTFKRTTKAAGKMKFKKDGPSMRWDYAKPGEKVFVIAAERVFAYDKEAKRLIVSRMSADRLSASITFLWGQGKLDREFRITKASRKDLPGGIALELTPKLTDPRFQKIFFLLDAKTFAVKETIVVDPDGSENRMTFSNQKTNTGLSNDAFKIEPPADVKVEKMDGI